jgi:hypothetical protein
MIRPPSSQHGVALFLVLLFSLLIGTVTFALLNSSLDNSNHISQYEERLKLQALAEGAIEMKIQELRKIPPLLEPLSTPEVEGRKAIAKAIPLGEHRYRIETSAQNTRKQGSLFLQCEIEFQGESLKLHQWQFHSDSSHSFTSPENALQKEESKEEVKKEESKEEVKKEEIK